MRFLRPIGLPLIFVLIVWDLTPNLNSLQRGWDDWLMQRHLTNHFNAPIKIVYFDENAIESLGGWPLPRNIYAFLAEKLIQLGAKTVAFDIYWGSRSLPPDENDLLLATVLAQQQNIFGSFYFEQIGQIEEADNNSANLAWPLKKFLTALEHASGLQAPAAEFCQGPGRYGFANLPVTSDGAVRETYLLLQNGNAIYPSFAHVVSHAFSSVVLDSSLAQIRINYRLPANQLPLLPVREVLEISDTHGFATELKGSLVLVGVISSQLGFAKPTPIDPAMPVVGIHAQIIDNLLARDYLRSLPSWLWLLILVAAGLMISWQQLQKIKTVLAAFSLLVVMFMVAAIMLWKLQVVFPLYAGGLGILLFFLPALIKQVQLNKKMMAEAITKREALEKQFAEAVHAVTRLQKENEAARKQYQEELTRLRRELTVTLPATPEMIQQDFPEIIHAPASPISKILAELPRIAATDAPVLITGESGTGKELVASAIHQKSRRQDQAFIAVNCSALAENLLESELFGHEKGAFTGAHQNKAGFFERANKGTIFLDEISATTPAFQAKLLRVLQEGQYFRVGSSQVRTVDVRVIAAANRPLEKLVAAGAFREDLYFRLNVLPIHLPPLRDRRDDIPLLLSHFLHDANCQLSAEAMRLLQTHTWPGNIRELQNLAARMRVLADGRIIDSDWVRQQLHGVDATSPPVAPDSMDDKILQLYRELQFRNDANTQIAERLGHLHRSTITEYLKGMTFLFFAETGFQLERAVRRFNPSPNPEFDARLENRMLKYLRNLSNELNPRLSLDENWARLQQRLRKLPQKYHVAAREVARAYLQEKWKL